MATNEEFFEFFMGNHEDGTPPTFMDVVDRVVVLMQIFQGAYGGYRSPGLDVCPHDDSYHRWLNERSGVSWLKALQCHDPLAATVWDVAKVLVVDQVQHQTGALLPWTQMPVDESLVYFAKELDVPPERIDKKVCSMLCNLHSVEDMLRSPLFLKKTKLSFLACFAKARETREVRTFGTQGLTKSVVLLTEEELQSPVRQMLSKLKAPASITNSFLRKSIRNKAYLFRVSFNGDCEFSGLAEQELGDEIDEIFDTLIERYNSDVAASKQKAEEAHARKVAAHEAWQTALHKAESEARLARRKAADKAKQCKKEPVYTPSGPSHSTPKPRANIEHVDDVTNAKRVTTAEESREAVASHELALQKKEALRLSQLEEQRKYRQLATAIQQGD